MSTLYYADRIISYKISNVYIIALIVARDICFVTTKNDLTEIGKVVMVDVNGLEPLTTRTSSECSTN